MTFEEVAYTSNVLTPERHSRLVREAASVARSAAIPVDMLWTSMKGRCSDPEIEYVTKLRRATASGLCYTGASAQEKVRRRMLVIAGACLRNFINTKVMTVHQVFADLRTGDMATPEVLMVPNFFVEGEKGPPEWQRAALFDLLIARRNDKLQTFLFVSDMKRMAACYGQSVVSHIEANYEELRII